jgi:hypothetical protein
MKKQKRGEKKLLLTKEKVKQMTQIQDDQLEGVAGGGSVPLVSNSCTCQSRTTNM